ncbi:hypothetical protein N7G274_000906 [Stereocaulon virgatum]|uniref:Uncharacterized protein n=1 Tax=Stereocaulon virgatum TaxID=373712 RepID=A0ABR4AMB1_9LECA
MASFSWCLLLALSFVLRPVYSVPQEQLTVTPSAQLLRSGAAPDLAGPASAASSACGGCYIVAGVAGLVWYSEIFVNTAATAIVSVGMGNGSSATRTSIIQNEGELTYNLAPTRGAGGVLAQVNYSPSFTLGGAVLTSPTAYNVFTAYSITSAFLSNGVCMTTSGSPILLSSAYTEILQSANGQIVLDASGQQSFIDFLGFTTCSGGGENVAATALVQVTNTTATMTSTFSGVPLAAVSATLTIAPKSVPFVTTAGSTTSSTPSTTVFPSAAAPQIVVANKTLTPTPNPIALPLFSGNVTTGTTTLMGITASGYFLATGTGANFSVPIAFIGKAALNKADIWLTTVWGASMMGLGVFVYYL